MSEQVEETDAVAEKEVEKNEGGKIKISNEVVTTIAGISATEIEGVAGMSGGLAGGLAEMLGRENLSKGVKVEVGDQEVAVDLYVIMENGVKIHEVAREIQNNVRDTIEDRTGLKVVEVNVNVQGVEFESQIAEEEAEEETTEINAPEAE